MPIHDVYVLGLPWHRIVMLAFAFAGYALVGFLAVFAWWVGRRAFGVVGAITLTLTLTLSGGLLWADGIAHVGKEIVIGPCNPFEAACNGELEGWTGVTTSASVAERRTFDAVKCGPPPGGNANPMMIWWGNPVSGTWCR